MSQMYMEHLYANLGHTYEAMLTGTHLTVFLKFKLNSASCIFSFLKLATLTTCELCSVLCSALKLPAPKLKIPHFLPVSFSLLFLTSPQKFWSLSIMDNI